MKKNFRPYFKYTGLIILCLLQSIISCSKKEDAIAVVKFNNVNTTTKGIKIEPAFLSKDKNACPNFKLKDLNNNIVELNNFKGSPIIINFWATWCAPCRREIPILNGIYNKYREKGLKLFSITMDLETDRKKIIKFIKKTGISYKVLFTSPYFENALGKIDKIPVTLVIDKKGIIRKKIVGEVNKALLEEILSKII